MIFYLIFPIKNHLHIRRDQQQAYNHRCCQMPLKMEKGDNHITKSKKRRRRRRGKLYVFITESITLQYLYIPLNVTAKSHKRQTSRATSFMIGPSCRLYNVANYKCKNIRLTN